ncbi:MAG TPA: molybdenum cofactor guanylyltransferase [Desulfobacterales bacterium]|jgi:molybdenum cofactor guanylyltransferase|nr:molybdenum cofactor guanylyltransferase [Desulfobacterales bacterium]
MRQPCSGVILAGGLSTRYSGENKAFLKVGGTRILDRLFAVYTELFDEIILVTNRPSDFLAWDALIVTDIFPVRSSLTGIHAGLFYARHPFAFFSACDTPFLKKEVVETVLDSLDPGIDLVIPRTSAGFEPLCAAYSQRCLKAAEDHILQNKFKIQMALSGKRVRAIPEDVLREKDPDLRSFFNVNSPEDLARAEQFVKSETQREAEWTSQA